MKKTALIGTLILTTMFLFNCDKNENPVSPKDTESVLKVIGSDSNGRLTTPSGVVC